MKLFKIALLLAGFFLLYLTLRAVGIESAVSQISKIGWKFLPVLAVYPFIYAFKAWGWQFAFPKKFPKQVPFWDFFRVRLIGETFNCLIPWAASLGGEPVKIQFLKKKHGIRRSEGAASILIVHTTLWFSLNAFVIGGLWVTRGHMPLTPVLKSAVIIFLISIGVAAFLLVSGFHWGIFKNTHRLFQKILKRESVSEKMSHYAHLDEEIKRFFTSNPKRFFISSFFNFAAWFAGIFETYFLARMLGMDVSFAQAWLLEALIQALRIVTFFIPSSIGAQEGGIVFIFSELGFATAPGLALAVLRRLREVLWVAAGLVLWAFSSDKSKES